MVSSLDENGESYKQNCTFNSLYFSCGTNSFFEKQTNSVSESKGIIIYFMCCLAIKLDFCVKAGLEFS